MRARLALPALLALALSGIRAADAAETWVEVRSPNFVVVSNAGEGTARSTAVEFEEVRAAFGKLWPWARLTPGWTTVVLALKNKDTLRQWAPAYFEVKGGIDVVSASVWGAGREYLLVRSDYRPANIDVTPNYNLYRGYLTLLLASSFERRLPLWLSNGLSGLMANASVHDQEVLVGRPVPWEFERFLEGPRLPLQTILDARAGSPLVDKEDQRATFDAQTYVLVHYLMFGDRGAHTAALSRFIQLWLAGRSPDQAWNEAFGDVRAVEEGLPNYARSKILSFARLRTEAKVAAEVPAKRVLSPAEVAGLRAAVHVAMGRPVEAQAAIREARTADPRSPTSYDAEGLLADRDGDDARARQAYQQAVELGSASAYSYYRAAQLAWKAQADAATLAGQRRLLEKAIELNGAYANAYSYLAEVLVQQGEAQAALAPALRAATLEQGRSYHRVALARVLQALGRTEDARKAAELGMKLAENDGERSNAERFLLFLDEQGRYARERSQHETSQKQQRACEGGDAAACAAILPDLDRACTDGQVSTCMYLSWLYSQGTGVPRDPVKAAGYVEGACAAGDKRACVEHAWALTRGEGPARDEARGRAELAKICDGGFYPACTRLGLVEAARPGSAARARAKALLARACDGGEQDACSLAKQLK